VNLVIRLDAAVVPESEQLVMRDAAAKEPIQR
jgi:hypothetical protein